MYYKQERHSREHTPPPKPLIQENCYLIIVNIIIIIIIITEQMPACGTGPMHQNGLSIKTAHPECKEGQVQMPADMTRSYRVNVDSDQPYCNPTLILM